MLGWVGGGRVPVHEHQGLSKRAELISVGEGRAGRMEGDALWGGRGEEGSEYARGQAGQVWVAGHLSR